MNHALKPILFVLGLLFGAAAFAQPVEIVYWQYDFATRIDAMNQLIERFEAENPDITVVQETFPYDAYQQQVAASLPAGQGPDVIQLFYGWLPAWQRAGYLEPLPDRFFDTAALDGEFVPMAQAGKIGGEYYGLPTAVRSLALFYNADMLREAGFDGPPETWSEFIEVGKALTEKRGSRFTQVGYGFAPGGQDHHLVREVLTRQFGTPPYDDELTEVLYDSPEGLAAFEFYTSLMTEHEIGVTSFVPGNNGYREGFGQLENIAMIIDGSFAVGSIRNAAQFDWGVAELPVREEGGVKANFGSFWMNGLTANAFQDDRRLEASAKFLDFVTQPEAMKLWLEVVGELPARQSLVDDPAMISDPVFGPFISSLAYATATRFVDETAQRDVIVDAIDRVVLEDVAPAQAWDQAAAEDQALLDQFTR
ncbi:MAG: extracellular solute-binding protein [Trueperaceae bacterium]